MKKYKIANDLVPMINKIKIPTKKKKPIKLLYLNWKLTHHKNL